MDDKRIDSFDDLFEPFELDEGPPPEDLPELPAAEPEPTVACPSCGAANPTSNRHCEQCGARLSGTPLPVAPPPLIRTTPGGRALGALAALVLVVALIALLVQIFGGDDTAGPADDATTSTSSSTIAPVSIQQLKPVSVEASTFLTGFEPEHLIDADPTNSWNDKGLRGEDAWLRFTFGQPVRLTELEFRNVSDEERFKRNYRIKSFTLEFDDVLSVSGTLDDLSRPDPVQISTLQTTVVTIRVTGTWPAENFDGKPPFNELALEEVRFYGQPAGS